eukprot:TRINITY_DN32199_c0_g1_i1.p1 TRINITY_DN32199_c0_g1~~TRINITY_DN32199_c0_g1_i1.p1  ORF type:complete len:665 (+),score=117.81 TRINITY_DN32199_c0_g1_i1:227-2221(+)
MDAVIAAFQKHDNDGDGSLAEDHVKQLLSSLGLDCTDALVATFMAEVDMNRNGKIELRELVRWIFRDSEQGRLAGIDLSGQLLYQFQRWWAMSGWCASSPGFSFGLFSRDPHEWQVSPSPKAMSENAPPMRGPAAWHIYADDFTDEQGWMYATEFEKVDNPREGGRGYQRATDTVRRRVWVSPAARSALPCRCRTLDVEQCEARQDALKGEHSEAMHTSMGVFLKVLKRRPMGALLALEPVAWARCRSDGFEKHASLQARLAQVPLDEQDSTRLRGILFALPYAKAVYGYPMMTGCMDSMCKLAKSSLQRLKTPSFDPLLSPDCATNIEAMLELCGRSEADLLHVHFDAKPMRPAHAVLVDHPAKAVVLTVRGTLRPEDAITDAMATEVSGGDLGYAGGSFHLGISRAAMWVLQESRDALAQASNDHPEYTLVITGHSLGAGTAAILTLILGVKCSTPSAEQDSDSAFADLKSLAAELGGTEDIPRLNFRLIKGYTFACPGVVSPDVAESSHALNGVTSVACRHDVIVRTCMRSIDRLLYAIQSKSVAGTVAGAASVAASSAKSVVFGESGAASQSFQSEWPQHRTVGTCYWMPDPEGDRILRASASDFDEMVVNESMLPDHLFSRYEKGLQLVSQSLGLEAGLPSIACGDTSCPSGIDDKRQD